MVFNSTTSNHTFSELVACIKPLIQQRKQKAVSFKRKCLVVMVAATYNLLTHVNRRVMQSRKPEENSEPIHSLESRKLHKILKIMTSKVKESLKNSES